MGHIRPFVQKDIPQVARLHRTVWPGGDRDGPDALQDYFTGVFIENPSATEDLPSFVYEERDGRIVGFLGVVPRRMTMNGRRFLAAVSSQFIVDPASLGGLVALALAKAFLEGPQDLSIADEANDLSRRIWEGLGGTASLLHSLFWTRPLRPTCLAVSLLRNRREFAAVAAAAKPLAAIVDGLAARIPRSHFRQTEPSVGADELRGQTVLAHAPELYGRSTLRVEYDVSTLEWLLRRAGNTKAGGQLLKAVLKKDLKILGWYICHLGRDGIADALQVTATPSSIHEVLDHLFYYAWQRGAVAVTGRLDPRFMQALSDKYCLFHRRGPWLLIKTKEPELLHSFQTGDVWFSRIDGEWSLRF